MKTGLLFLITAALVQLGSCKTPSKEDYEKDLKLVMVAGEVKKIEAGDEIPVTLSLRNASDGATYQIVKPGDGSEIGWREPHVFYTATIDTGDGKEKPVQQERYGRCGLYDPEWQKDIVALKPGEAVELCNPMNGWIPMPTRMLDFQQAGHVKLYAHYRYSMGMVKVGAQPGSLGAMAGVPSFEIISAPLEFDVVRPLDLVVRAKAPLKLNSKPRLSELLDIRLVNRSKEPMEVSSSISDGNAISLRLVIGDFETSAELKKQNPAGETTQTLKPGEEVEVLGAGRFAGGLDGAIEYGGPEALRVQASFHNPKRPNANPIRSEWVEIKPVPETKE